MKLYHVVLLESFALKEYSTVYVLAFCFYVEAHNILDQCANSNQMVNSCGSVLTKWSITVGVILMTPSHNSLNTSKDSKNSNR